MTEPLPPENNTRGLLRSMVVIASAQLLSIVIRILKAKLVAVLLGPSGTGLLSVFANLQQLGSQAAGLGLAQSGVRDLAASRGDAEVLGRLKHVLMITLALQGGIAMTVIWLMREQLSVWLLGEAVHVTEIGLVGVAVLLFLLASSQQTLLRGMRRIGDLGRVMVLGTLAGAVVGMAAVWLMGRDGLIWFLLAEPLGALLVGMIYVRRLPLPAGGWPHTREIWQRWRPMVRLGMAFMLGGLLTTATLLLVRTLITRDLGLSAAGQFAAAWSISGIYFGFILQAMGNDYFPRISETIGDRHATTQLMNDQIQLGLSLAAPILLLMIGLAPWIVPLLYSHDFDAAINLVQWLALGDIIKLAGFPFGFYIVASGRSVLYLSFLVLHNILFLGVLWISMPVFGLEAAALSVMCAYAISTTVTVGVLQSMDGFKWQAASIKIVLMHLTLALVILVLAKNEPIVGAIAAILCAIVTILLGGHAVISKTGSHGRIISHASRFYDLIGWPVRGKE